MAAPHVELHSRLSPEECLDRLRSEIDSPCRPFGSRAVVGSVGRTTFTGRRRIFYRNSFQALVFATVRPDGGGSHIALRLGMHPFVVAFMALVKGGGAPQTWTFLVAPGVMAGFGVGLLHFGRWLGRDDPAVLQNFLMRTLEATGPSRTVW